MASLLSSHLDAITLSANSLSSLTFSGPARFTNALLHTHDITSLIRDTEQHERALFHLAPPSSLPQNPNLPESSLLTKNPVLSSTTTAANRRATVYGTRQPKNKAVAAVLGGDLYRRTRREDGAVREKGEVDVELLLAGAEKLAAVYPIAGATEKIAQLRRRHHQLTANIAHYQDHVARQARELSALTSPETGSFHDEDFEIDLGDDEQKRERDGSEEKQEDGMGAGRMVVTMEDMEREEEEIKDLERKKRGLEDRVTGMERDLGGLMR